MSNYMEENAQELYMALNPQKNKSTPLATNTSSSYNKVKETSGSYTGAKTGFNISSNYVPGQISKDTTPTVKTQTPKVETQNTPKTSGIGETYRAKTESINKPLPKLEEAKQTSPMYQKSDTLKSLSVPTKLERDFAKGIFGDKKEAEIYNSGILEEAAKAGYLKDTRTQDDFFRTGFLGLEDKPKYAFTEKADDKVKYDLFNLLDFDKTPQSRINAFKEIRNRGVAKEVREAYNGLPDNTLPRMEDTTQHGFVTPAGATSAEKIMDSFHSISEKNAQERADEFWASDVPYGKVDDAEMFARYPELELQKNKAEEEKSFWDYAYDVLTVASLIPGIDTFTNIGSAVVNLIRGDYIGAGLDLLGAIPFVGEVADGAKYARYADSAIGLMKTADKASDAAKYADKASETLTLARSMTRKADDAVDMAKAVNKADDAYDAAKVAGKKTSIFDNAEEISKKYPIDKYGNFGQKGKNVQTILSSDPVETSSNFYEMIKKGGIEGPLPNGKGVKTVFEDGTTVIYRVKTSTPDSPAVNINIEISGPIKKQKIHFIKE